MCVPSQCILLCDICVVYALHEYFLFCCLSLIKGVRVTYGSYWGCVKCVQRIPLRCRSVLSNRTKWMCYLCDLDLRPYIPSAIFIVLSPLRTGLFRLIDSILNHITSITNCFILQLHLSIHWHVHVCVCVGVQVIV